MATDLIDPSKSLTNGSNFDEKNKSTRDIRIDAFRYGLSFLVVILHSVSNIIPDSSKINIIALVQMACRSAVPFFFISSGYFISGNAPTIQLAWRPLQRLLPIYIFWMMVYYIFLKIYPILRWHASLRDLISGGAAFHLWFLPALGLGLALVGIGMRLLGTTITGLICAGLAVLALADGSYHDVFALAGETRRGGTLIAPAFIFIGTYLARARFEIRTKTAFILFIASNAFLVSEEFTIKHFLNSPNLVSHDFILSTFLVGISIFLLSKAIATNLTVEILSKFGRISLGVYAIHILILWPISRLIGRDNIFQALLEGGITFILSSGSIAILRRVGFLSRVIE